MLLALIILTLSFEASWQQEITEKTLNDMLEQLLEETVKKTFKEENENSSRIIYLAPDNITRRSQERLNVIHSSEFEDLENLVHQIENSKDEANPKQTYENTVLQEITVEIERTGQPKNVGNDNEATRQINIINSGFSHSGRPLFEDIPDHALNTFVSETESDLIHKYPEIIIEKITYDDNENKIEEENEYHRSIQENKVSSQKNSHTNVNNYNEVKKDVAATALDSIVKILKGVPKKKPIVDSNEYLQKDDMNALLSSTHIHNAFHNHVINNIPLEYSRNMLLGKLPNDYQDLHRVINKPRSAYLDPNLQLSRWGGNAGQNSLMGISRAHNLNHVHFIPKRLNMMPSIVYQPFYHRHHFL